MFVKNLIVYGPIGLALIVAMVYRYSYIARLCSIALLCIPSFLHYGFLMVPHRLAHEQVARQVEEREEGESPDDYELLLTAIRNMGQRELNLFATLTVAWTILAIVPVRRRAVVT